MRSVRAYVPAVLLFIGCAAIWNARSQAGVPLAAPMNTILAAVPGLRVQDQLLSADERRVAGMSDYVARVYWRDTTVAFTTFVSYYERQTQGRTIHSPRNCLPGAGWEVLSSGTQTVNVDGVDHTLNRYVLKKGAATAIAFYWYQGRGRVVANEYTVKWNLLRDAAVAGHTEEALVRVVVPVADAQNPADAAEHQRLLNAAGSVGADISSRLMREVTRVLPKSA
jgi:EpsI family protein